MSIHTPYMDSPNVNVTKESGLEAATYTPEVLRDFHSKDPDLELNLTWLRDNEEPSEATIFRCSQRAKKYWLSKEIFFIDESGLLRNVDKHSSISRLVNPRDLTEEIMALCHDIPASGQQGINRTMKRIKDKYQWYGMAQSIRNFVETCSFCNSSKKANKGKMSFNEVPFRCSNGTCTFGFPWTATRDYTGKCTHFDHGRSVFEMARVYPITDPDC